MPKADRIKEQLVSLEVVSMLVVVDVSLVAWVAQNFGGLNRPSF